MHIHMNTLESLGTICKKLLRVGNEITRIKKAFILQTSKAFKYFKLNTYYLCYVDIRQ